MNKYDYVVIGAGIYGLYAAKILGKKFSVLVLDIEKKPFLRASYINQARVHNGYHYPRSLATAIKSSKYYDRFVSDFQFAINDSFQKIYAISRSYSYTNSIQFEKFCRAANIKCAPILLPNYINNNTIESAYETNEYSFDAKKISTYFVNYFSKSKQVKFRYGVYINKVEVSEDNYVLTLTNDEKIKIKNVINATYASSNQVLRLFNIKPLNIKYEICEIALCKVPNSLKKIGITIMDGPFCSVMPFGLSGFHSLTSVQFTPHLTCKNEFPNFYCQTKSHQCTNKLLMNCNTCLNKPKTSFVEMNQIFNKYINNFPLSYLKSLYAIKPILNTSELDDSRPTLIKVEKNKPGFISILSGKINTIYDLDDILL